MAGIGAEEVRFSDTPRPPSPDDHQITLRKCVLRRKHLHASGDPITLNINQAIAILAPSRTKMARMNVIKLRPQSYIGIRTSDSSNFVIVNPTSDGDIRWLLKRNPELQSQIGDIYLVDSVEIRRNSISLPMDSVED